MVTMQDTRSSQPKSGFLEVHMITEAELSKILERAEAATDPPWVTKGYPYVVSLYKGQHTVADCSSHAAEKVHCTTRRANAEFMAHARDDVPRLVAEVRRLQGLLEKSVIDSKVGTEAVEEACDLTSTKT